MKKGFTLFTLIELLVVIAIGGILISIIVASLQKTKIKKVLKNYQNHANFALTKNV